MNHSNYTDSKDIGIQEVMMFTCTYLYNEPRTAPAFLRNYIQSMVHHYILCTLSVENLNMNNLNVYIASSSLLGQEVHWIALHAR